MSTNVALYGEHALAPMRHISPTLTLLVVLLATALPARAADRTWTGAGGTTNWHTAANWSDDAVPGGGDRALITGASVQLTAAASAQAIVLGAGATLDATGFVLTLGTGPSVVETGALLKVGEVPGFNWDALVFDGPISVRGQLDWANGQIRTTTPVDTRILTVEPGGLMRWLAGGERIIYAAIVNNGTIRWEGDLTIYDLSYPFTNNGTVELALAADAEFRATRFGTGALVNNGTVRKTGAGVALFSTVPLRTTGAVDVQEGTLMLTGSSRWDNASATVATGATLRLAGNGPFAPNTIAGTFSAAPAGTLILDGLPNENTSILIGETGARLALGGTGFQVDNGQLGGFDLTAATREAPTNAGLLRFVGPSISYISGPFVNEGMLRWEGPGDIVYHLGSPFTNSGTFEMALAADAELRAGSGGPGALVNTGTVRKTGAGTATFTTVQLRTSSAVVDVQGGTLLLKASSRWQNATVAVSVGARLELSHNGNGVWHEIDGTLSGDPQGTFLLATNGWASGMNAAVSGGTLALGGTGLQVDYSYLGGFDGTTTREAPTNTGLLRIVASNATRIEGAFVNEGTLRWEGSGPFYYAVGSSFTNTGLLELAPSADAVFSTAGINGGRPGPLVNTGTMRKTGAATVTTNIDFAHQGATIEVQGGTLRTEWGTRYENSNIDVATGAAMRIQFGLSRPTVIAGLLTGTAEGTLALRGQVLSADPVMGGRLDIGGTGLSMEYQSSLGGNPDGQGIRSAPINEGLIRFADADATIGSPFVNRGTVQWTTGILRLIPGATFSNVGLFEIAAAGQTLECNCFTVSATLLNELGGVVRKAGPGQTTLRVNVATRGEIALAAGTLRIDNVDNQNTFSVLAGGVLSGTGTLDVSALGSGNGRVQTFGTVAPGPGTAGAGIGTLTWSGTYAPDVQSRLIAEGGPNGTGDRLSVVGTASLGFQEGLVRLIGGYQPTVGDAFDVLTATSVIAPFDTVRTVNPGGNIVFEQDYAVPGRITLRAVEGMPTPPFVVLPSPLVSGGPRTATLVGAGVESATAAVLVCVSCVDPDALGQIPGEILSSAPGQVDVLFDLTPIRAFGDYDLVLTVGTDSPVASVRIDPYTAQPIVVPVGLQAVAVFPAPLARAVRVNLYNATNSAEPTVAFVQVTPPHPSVRYVPSLVRMGPGEATAPLSYFVPIQPAFFNSSGLAFLTGIDPADVRFPGSPLLADDPRVPFGGIITGNVTAYGHMAPAQFTEMLAAFTVKALAAQGNPVSLDDARAAARSAVENLLSPGASRDGPGATQGMSAQSLGANVLSGLGRDPAGAGAFDGFGEPGAQVIQTQLCTADQSERQRRRQTMLDTQRRISDLSRQTTINRATTNGQVNRVWIQYIESYSGFGEGSTETCLKNREPVPLTPRAAFDPNDKQAVHARGCEIVGTGEDARCARYTIPLAEADSAVTYAVAFENVAAATGPAETATVTDILDDDFDPATLEVLTTTADSLFSYTVSGQTVTFVFSGINLPPNQNPPEGEGSFTFRVRPRSGLPDGTEFRNSADIVFDFNPPIVTPEVVHVIRATAGLGLALDVPSQGTMGQPVTATVVVSNAAGSDPAEAVSLTVPIPFGATLIGVQATVGACSGTTTLTCSLGEMAAGASATVTFTVEPTSVGTLAFTSSVATATFDGTWYDNAAAANVEVMAVAGEEGPGLPTTLTLAGNRPNPFRERTILRVGLPTAATVAVTIHDLLGREVARVPTEPMDAGWHDVTLDARGLAAGVYVAVIQAGEARATHRLLVVR